MSKNKRYQKRHEKRRILRLKDGTIVGPHEDLRHRNFSGVGPELMEYLISRGATL